MDYLSIMSAVPDRSMLDAIRSSLATLLAVVIGWCLNEVSTLFRTRRDDRRVVGRTLADLLEIRFGITARRLVIDLLKNLGLPVELVPQMNQALEAFYPSPEKLYDRYNASLDALAGPFPLLAFYLRSKEILTPTLRKLRELTLGNQTAASWFFGIESDLVQSVLPALDEAILAVAWRYGPVTWWKTRRQLNRKSELPDMVHQTIDRHLKTAPRAEPSPGGEKNPRP